MNKNKIQIAVVSHKDYQFPTDSMYIPYFVGPIIQEKQPSSLYLLDNEGENISHKNSNYCELTAQYSLWKNSTASIKGLVHYRRHFFGKNKFDKENPIQSVINSNQVKELLQQYDMIVPNKRHYYIETMWSHYEHSHHIEGLILAKKIIEEDYPDYTEAFNTVMNARSAHMFNMFIAKRELFDEYSAWLFDILEKIEKKLDIRSYSTYEARVYGFISELLLDVWIEYHHINYIEQKVRFIEPQNWFKKGGKFLMRKFKGGIIE